MYLKILTQNDHYQDIVILTYKGKVRLSSDFSIAIPKENRATYLIYSRKENVSQRFSNFQA